LVLLTAGIVAHIILASYFNFTQDDAYITFRYAANFVNGEGLVYNAGERVEGFTNFLWTVVMILARRVGFELALFSKILGVICGCLTIVMTFLLASKYFGKDYHWSGLSAFMLGTMLSFGYWSVAGLETAAFALMVTASLYFYRNGSYLTVAALILATLLRPEGFMVFGLLILFDIATARRMTRFVPTALVIYAGALLPFLAFKWFYYGTLLPNPFYAKTNFGSAALADGIGYAALFFLHYAAAGLFLLPAVYVSIKKRSAPTLLWTVLIIYCLYIVVVGGDVLKVHRFFVPLMPLVAIMIIYGLVKSTFKAGVIIPVVVIVLAWQIYVPRRHVADYHEAEKGLTLKMELLCQNLRAADKSNFSLAVSTIGMVGYQLPGHTVIDILGLTDTTIARHPEPPVPGLKSSWKERHYNTPYLLSRKPDYILFSTASKPSAPGERALFLYREFLENYRTISFFLGGKYRDIYKRMYDKDIRCIPEIDPRFVQLYSRAFEYMNARQYVKAENAFRQAMYCLPDSIYHYSLFYMSYCRREMGDHAASYALLNRALEIDTMCHQIYSNLFIYEHEFRHDYEKAERYRNRIKELMPWFLPILDGDVDRK